MKATGVVRRIDELGRIVIPKEIRRTLRIKEGTPLEIYSGDSGELYLKKYSPIVELGELSAEVCESIFATTNNNVLVTNMETVISASGTKKNNYINIMIDSHIERLINARKTQIVSMADENTRVFTEAENIKLYVISPIIANGDVYGSIIIFNEANNLGETEIRVASAFAEYLGRQIS